MVLLEVLAILAGMLLVATALILIALRRAKLRMETVSKPIYPTGNQTVYSLADWYVACDASLRWSRSRRNKRSK